MHSVRLQHIILEQIILAISDHIIVPRENHATGKRQIALDANMSKIKEIFKTEDKTMNRGVHIHIGHINNPLLKTTRRGNHGNQIKFPAKVDQMTTHSQMLNDKT